jgi:predicted GNAT superfamily acetyltransferase
MEDITYRRLTKIEEMHAASDFITSIWGDEGYINPFLFIAQSHVGCVLNGAFKKDKVIGLNYGFIGKDENQSFLYSHILAVHPDFRASGIGAELKKMQAVYAKKQGLNCIKWTFDPLQSKNAYFNFHKLGATCNIYVPNFYGKMTNKLNRGVDSDRLLIEWNLGEEKRSNRNTFHESIMKFPFICEQDYLVPVEWKPRDELIVAIPVPSDIQKMKEANALQCVQSWQKEMRKLFQHYFNHGYQVVDFKFEKSKDIQYYILKKEKNEVNL